MNCPLVDFGCGNAAELNNGPESILVVRSACAGSTGNVFIPKVPEGKMFPIDGSFIHSALPDELWDEGCELNEKLVATLPSPFSGIYLGGFGGSNGGDSDPLYVNPSKGKLLVRVTDEGDRSVGIVASCDDSGTIIFSAIDRY